ncbi:MAG TPA: tetratricopeptide repeat protein [Rudaea sp.]|nr:tetratricopeptide repeat protein [Rudaea sp.]
MSLLHHRIQRSARVGVIGAAAAVFALLAGCSTMPRTSHSTAAAQPLQRMNLPTAQAKHDPLALQIAAEFAVNKGDLPSAARDYAQAAQISDDPVIAGRATRVAIAASQWPQARLSLRRWQELNAQDPDLWQVRAMVALHDGKTDAAYADLLRLAHLPDAAGWRSIAQALVDALDKQQALEILHRMATAEFLGSNARTWVAVSQLALHLGDPQLARTLADDAVERFGDADAYTWAAQIAYRSGNSAAARELFEKALKHDPKNEQLRRAFASLLGQLGENLAAAHVLAQGPQDDLSYATRAAYVARADDQPAIAALYREIKAIPTPHSGAQLNLLGELAELMHRSAEAIDWYRRISDDDEHWFGAQLRRALLMDESGKHTAAMDLIHSLQARSGDDSRDVGNAFLLEAEILVRHQQRQEALAVYARGLKVSPDDSRLLYARALLNEDLGHIDLAIGDLRQMIKLDPNNADALNALGYTLANSGKDGEEALTLIEKALALKPGEPAIIDSLGWAQYRLGNLDEAIKQLRVAYAKQPDAEIAAHLGEVLWKSGQKQEAKKIWAQGRKKDEKNKVLLETIKRFET